MAIAVNTAGAAGFATIVMSPSVDLIMAFNSSGLFPLTTSALRRITSYPTLISGVVVW
jgi:hypothetical protein